MDIKQGDARTLRWKVNADLTGATVRFLASKSIGGDPVMDKAATVEDATEASTTLAVAFTSADTAEPASLLVEFEATKGGVVQTFPSDGYGRLTVAADLG